MDTQTIVMERGDVKLTISQRAVFSLDEHDVTITMAEPGHQEIVMKLTSIELHRLIQMMEALQ